MFHTSVPMLYPDSFSRSANGKIVKKRRSESSRKNVKFIDTKGFEPSQPKKPCSREGPWTLKPPIFVTASPRVNGF
jgi:hypothetical protein